MSIRPNKIISFFSKGKTFSEIEPELLKATKECAVELSKMYFEQVDAEILNNKEERRKAGYSVERRGDERQLQTQIGDIVYNRTYYKKASGGYEYITDTCLG
ncbi:MAG: UPF0236 family protein [Eubacteriales bacterium]|nr:UPF0236 family protein [Eubacteriales bacterium]